MGQRRERRRRALRLEGIVLSPQSEATRTILYAQIRAVKGDLPAARAAIAAARGIGPVVDVTVQHREGVAALVAALDRQSADALRILDAWKYGPASMARTRLEARAHACAAAGRVEDATRALHDLERGFGPSAITFLAERPGPAQALARAHQTASARR